MIVAYDEAWNRHDVAAILDRHTDDSVFESHTTGECARGKDAIRRMIERLFATFPDVTFTIRRLYAQEGLVVQEWTAHATHTRPVPTRDGIFPATGDSLSWQGVDVMPMRDDLIVRKDAYADTAALLRQLVQGRR